jgi:NADH-quinone oxidoreductase subunit E
MAELLLTRESQQEIDAWLAKFPPEHRRSAVLAALRIAQDQNSGYLTRELMDAVAQYLAIPPIQVYEAATFYSMLHTEPAGRHKVSICNNISCMLRGADEIVEYAEEKLGIKRGESTTDRRIHLVMEEECLAACCGAPMMMVDHVYYEKLTPATVDQILDGLE